VSPITKSVKNKETSFSLQYAEIDLVMYIIEKHTSIPKVPKLLELHAGVDMLEKLFSLKV